MVKYLLDAVAHAIAAGARRDMLDRLALGPASMTELAEAATVTLPAVDKHLAVLVEAGLAAKSKAGRVTRITLVPGSLDGLASWALKNGLMWENALDRLATHVRLEVSDDPVATRGFASSEEA